MKRTDLVTEMRMNKMSLLLNILEKEEFGYLQHIYCQKKSLKLCEAVKLLE